MRSRPDRAHEPRTVAGITSACAEQTEATAATTIPERDHLRVCGADEVLEPCVARTYGSPPRVRSRRDGRAIVLQIAGITSACAEQTGSLSRSARSTRDHLRVCGADGGHRGDDDPGAGSPPRVRSRPTLHQGRPPLLRITSACAEQTRSIRRWTAVTRDHLRVCGADAGFQFLDESRVGSPPRVRSRQTVAT